MTGTFFALAFIAAANPKLLALDLLLIENRRPRAMFACILAGAIATGVTVGLIDVLVVHLHAVSSQGKLSAGVDLALGLVLLAIGGLLMTGMLARVWERRPRSQRRAGNKRDEGMQSRAQRALREPRLGLAVLVGIICGLPGAAYLTALHDLVGGHYGTATKVAAVFLFVIIEMLLLIVPWLALEIRPAATATRLRQAQAWLAGHAIALIAWVFILLGVYLTVSATVRLAS